MHTNIEVIDSITICKGDYGYHAYLRFKDRFYDRDIANENLDTVYSLIESYLFKTFHIRSR